MRPGQFSRLTLLVALLPLGSLLFACGGGDKKVALDDWVADVARVFDEHALADVVLVGHSMGGVVCQAALGAGALGLSPGDLDASGAGGEIRLQPRDG